METSRTLHSNLASSGCLSLCGSDFLLQPQDGSPEASVYVFYCTSKAIDNKLDVFSGSRVRTRLVTGWFHGVLRSQKHIWWISTSR